MSTISVSAPSVNGDPPLRQIRVQEAPPSALIVADNHEIRVDPNKLANPEQVAAVTEAVGSSTEASFAVDQIVFLPEPFRTDVLRFLDGLEQAAPGRLTYVDENSQSSSRETNLFDAALCHLCGHDDPARCNRSITLAVAAAAIQHPDALRAACSRIKARLKHLEVQGYRVDALIRLGSDVVRNGYPASLETVPHNQVLVADALDDRDDSLDDLVVPEGWDLDQNGISRSNSTARVTSAPMIIRKRLVDIETQSVAWEVAWRQEGHWYTRVIDRGHAADNRKLLELAQFGCTVHSNNSAAVIQFLADFEAANLDVLPVEHSAGTMGWHEVNGGLLFVCGRDVITSPQQDTLVHIRYRGADAGEEQLASGFHASGTFDAWRTAISELRPFPRVKIALFASAAAPLLSRLGAPNFTLSYAAPTSLGKTTTLAIAASMWGCPSDCAPAAAMFTWDATRVFIERFFACLGSLPGIVDDTKLAKVPHDVTQTIYDVRSGRGRNRGSLDGLRVSRGFRTLLITSGEVPISSFSEEGGIRARSLEIGSGPFGEPNPQTAELINVLTPQICANYGHAGPRLIAFWLANRPRWPEYQAIYERRQAYYRAHATNTVAGRLAVQGAALDTAAIVGRDAGIWPWPYDDVVEQLWPELTAETRDADRAEAALGHIAAWAHSHREEFIDERNSNFLPPANGWAGKWNQLDRRRAADTACLCILVLKLHEELKRAGFDVSVIKTWNGRGWLRTNGDDRNTLAVRMARACRGRSSLAPTIAIRWSAINALIGAEDDSNEAGLRSEQIAP